MRSRSTRTRRGAPGVHALARHGAARARRVQGAPSASCPPPGRGCDFSRATFSVVALFLAAKKDKLKVDWREACEATGVDEEDFQKVHNSMRDLCYDLVGGGEGPAAPPPRSRRAASSATAISWMPPTSRLRPQRGKGKGAPPRPTAAGGASAERPQWVPRAPSSRGGSTPGRARTQADRRRRARRRREGRAASRLPQRREEKPGAAAAVARARAHTQGGAGPSGVGDGGRRQRRRCRALGVGRCGTRAARVRAAAQEEEGQAGQAPSSRPP